MTSEEQIKELQHRNNLMKQLATTDGFYKYYFSNLKNHKTAIDCFNHTNDLHMDLFGDTKYSSWYSFRSNKKYYKNL